MEASEDLPEEQEAYWAGVRQMRDANNEQLRIIAEEDEQERIDKEYRRMKVEGRDREALRSRVMSDRMPDLPTKEGRSLPTHLSKSERARDEWIANREKPQVVHKKSTTKTNDTKQGGKRVPVKKSLPTPTTLRGGSGGGYRESLHPRDRLGRFASKAVKAVVIVGKNTVKGVKSAHKAIKRVRVASRKRHALEMRERAVILREREKKLGKRKRVVRRRKK